jgi:preprotein translocase subunit YajC
VELFPLVILVLAFVLLIIVPARQRRKVQEQQRVLQESLTPGTPVMTTAGLHGTVAALGEGTVDLEIAPGVVVTFARQAVLEVRKPAVGGPAADGTVLPGDDADGGPADRTR